MLPDSVDASPVASRQRMGNNSKRIEEHYSSVFSLGIVRTSPRSSLRVGFGNHNLIR